jgi:hypothetical protein
MKKKLSLFCMLAFAWLSNVAAQADADSAAREYRDKIMNVQRALNIVKTKIANDFPKIDPLFFPLTDSAFLYSQREKFSYQKRLLYANTLLRYLNIVYNTATDEEMAKGKLNDGLKYFLILVEWDSKNVLLPNLFLYRKFTLSHASLIPDEKISERFIVEVAKESPSEVLRYSAQFGQRSFGMNIIDSLAAIAPDLVKKYLYTDNAVSYNIVRSKSLTSRYLLGVYRNYGQRSNAYLLAYNVLKGEFTMDAADSIGDNAHELFKLLVNNMKQPDAIGKHSVYQAIENYSIDQVRKINDISLNETGYSVSEYLNFLSSEDLFTVLVYGHRELSLQGFTNLLGAIKRKIYYPYSHSFISSLHPSRLKQFLAFCERNDRLDMILQMVDGKSLSYLYQIMSQPELPNMQPDFSITDSADIQKLFRSLLPETDITASLKTNAKFYPDKDPLPSKVLKEHEQSVVQSLPSASTNLSLADENPVKPFVLRLSDKEKHILQLKKNIITALKEIPKFINESYAEELLMFAARHEPDEVFKRFDAFKTKYFATRILEIAGKASPTSLKRYIYNSSHPIAVLLQKSNDTVIGQIMKMPAVVGYQSKAYILADAIVRKRLTPTQAENICHSPQCMFKELVNIAKQKDYIGRYSVDRELTDLSLRFLREINDNIASNEPEPFRIVENFSKEEIYFLMVFGREEVITGSFNGLYVRFKNKLRGENVFTLLQQINKNRFRTFISMCSTYGKLDEVLAEIEAEQRDTLLVDFIRLSKDENNNDGVEIAETINNMKEPSSLLVVHSQIKKEYERAERDSNHVLLAVYGVLASLVDGNAVTDLQWFYSLSRQIKLPAVSQLPAQSLIAGKEKCIEQMYFYNDIDGRESFNNFLNTFKVLPAWRIEERGTYVVVKSVEGNAVEIYANKPEFESNGQDAINEYFKANGLKPTVVIHRGHSFHTPSTLQNVDEHVKLLLVGSCGGFYKLSYAIDHAPDAHIISTKQIGTKFVNDPILLHLNEFIRTGKNIVWKDFWEQMRQKIGSNPHFTDYVPPHQNLKSLFSKAYFSLLGV